MAGAESCGFDLIGWLVWSFRTFPLVPGGLYFVFAACCCVACWNCSLYAAGVIVAEIVCNCVCVS